jgi:hypothetical protein
MAFSTTKVTEDVAEPMDKRHYHQLASRPNSFMSFWLGLGPSVNKMSGGHLVRSQDARRGKALDTASIAIEASTRKPTTRKNSTW